MEKKDLTKLTIEELLIEEKKQKSSYNSLQAVVLIMLFIAAFMTIRNGFGFFSFLPFIWILLMLSARESHKKAQNEIQSRKETLH